MSANLILILASLFHGLALISIRPMLPLYNRPEIFRGAKGDKLFLFMQIVIIILSLSIFIWSFLYAGFLKSILFIIGSFLVAPLVARFIIPTVITRTALGPIVSSIALLILNLIAWSIRFASI